MNMVIPWTKVWAVVITGLSVVFLALVLLIIFVSLFGKIFSSMGNKKKQESPAPAVKKAPEPAVVIPEPVVAQAEDDDEVIAVISAAVAMMAASDGKSYAVRSIKRTANQNRQAGSVWSAAGKRENTRPF